MKASGQIRIKRKIAARYAKALWKAAGEHKTLEDTHACLLNINDLIENSAELRLILENPEVPHEKKEALLRGVFEGEVPAIVYRLLLLLHDKDRLNILKEVCFQFHQLYLLENKILEAEVTSAGDLEEDQIKDIVGRLEKRFRQKVVPSAATDPRLLGGFRVRVRDEVCDYSVKFHLEKFRERLLNS